MKSLLAMTVVFGFAVGFVGCGTEDDPTLGIDDQDMTYEAELTSGRCDVDWATNKLTGKCRVTTTQCLMSPGIVAICPVGAAANVPKIGYCQDRTPFKFDVARSACSW